MNTAPNASHTYFKDESSYPFLQPLKDNWSTIRDEVDLFFADDSLSKGQYAIPTSGKRAMRSDATLWKTIPFLLHGKAPADLVAEYDIKTVVSSATREYVNTHHFKRSRPFLLDFASVPEHGVLNVFISYFEPGARLGLHINNDPYMYRAHLGLSVPDGDVAFKVCDETITWKEGDLFVFAPTNPHTAWNLTERPRIILIVDFFKPEEDRAKMRAMEREQFTRMIERNPLSFGMSGGMFDLDQDTTKRYAVPRIEATP